MMVFAGSKFLLFRKLLQKWNKDIFGNIFNGKRKLLRRLDKISFQMHNKDYSWLKKRQKEIWEEYQ